MKKTVQILCMEAMVFWGLILSGGCAAFRASTADVDVSETRHFDARFDYSDLRATTQKVVDDLIACPFLADKEDKPVFMIAGLGNRTSEYIDTKTITERMRTLLFKTGTIRFVNEARRDDLLKEQGYQAGHATPETQTRIGRQLGADYMMSGSLSEMKSKSLKQVRVSRQILIYYKMTVEVTDLESGELVWTTEEEFARQQSQPIIGW